MRSIYGAVLCGILALAAGAQTVTVSASNVSNLFGTKLASGRACFQATNNAGTPINFRSGGGAQITYSAAQPICTPVTAGAFSVTVPDTALTEPVNVCYHLTVKDLSTGQYVLGIAPKGKPSGYDCLQPTTANSWCTAGACNFDDYAPNLPAGTTGAGNPGHATCWKSETQQGSCSTAVGSGGTCTCN